MATTDVVAEQSTAENGAEEEAVFGSYTSVLNEALSLPDEWRFKLIHALLDTLAPQSIASAKRREAADKLVGFLAVEGKEPPTDEEVEKILEEARMEKYG